MYLIRLVLSFPFLLINQTITNAFTAGIVLIWMHTFWTIKGIRPKETTIYTRTSFILNIAFAVMLKCYSIIHPSPVPIIHSNRSMYDFMQESKKAKVYLLITDSNSFYLSVLSLIYF